MKVDGTEQRKLVYGESGVTLQSPRWSPMEDTIYYFREQNGTSDLVKLPITGRSAEPSVLVSGLQTGDYLTLSADGSQLAYTRSQSYSNLWLVRQLTPGSTTVAKPLTSETFSYNDPAISPDSRSVAFTMGSDIQSNVYRMAVDGGQPVQLTSVDASSTWSPAWSPDGSEIAYISNQGGTTRVWVVGSQGGNSRQLEKTDASAANNVLAWSPSRDLVYLTSGLHNLRRLNVETQEEKLLFPVDSKGWLMAKPIFSPDGKRIAIYWNQPPAGTWLITLDTLSTSFLWPYAAPFGWSPDGKLIYGFVAQDGRDILQLDPVNSKKTKSMISLPGIINGATVSPDGQRIIVSVGEEKSDVWILKDFDPQAAQAQ
jgi:Tol biopolymer transport system component